MTRYATLFGFGLFDESDPKYKAYVDRFAAFVKKKRIDEVIICGGHTNVNEPEKSEAGTIAEYLKPLIGNTKVHVEDKSIITEQNIAFAKQFIDFSESNQILVVAESVRFFKIYWMILDRWFGLSKDQIIEQWFEIIKRIYANPKKRGTAIELKDIKNLLVYKNVKITIDKYHKDYRSGMHTIISEPFEIESLYDRRVYGKFIEMTRAKFKMK